jgi:predicted short-subunit dehydrogenase-like oxidoreductase (DUF2520 family)
MRHPNIRTVVLLGAGNLAWHFGLWFERAGVKVVQVFSRTPKAGEGLAAELKTGYTNRLDLLEPDADLYLLAVTDDAIPSLVRQAELGRRFVIHAAGSVPMDVFSGKLKNFGVLYPLQTFTRGRQLNFIEIPLFIEANTERNLEKLSDLARKLSCRVYTMDSEKRAYLHLAAVIASNFPNHMFTLTDLLLKERNLSFDLLKPLIMETISKALQMTPIQAQTGPAARGNLLVIEKHMAILESHPEIKELYRVISESIMRMNNKE